MDDLPSDLPAMILAARSRAEEFLKQLALWLGVGSAAGAVSMVSLAAQLPNRDYGFQMVLPSLWAFLIGVIAAGASLVFISNHLSKLSEHYAGAHNREGYKAVIRPMPLMFSAPMSLAEEHNAVRMDLIAKHDAQHAIAETAWKWSERWRKLWLAAMVLSASAFIAGFAWPLIQVTLGKSLAPALQAPVSDQIV